MPCHMLLVQALVLLMLQYVAFVFLQNRCFLLMESIFNKKHCFVYRVHVVLAEQHIVF